jgi:hypothetical protein
MSKPVFYIAGPITGVADYKQKFAQAERLLKDLGAEVFNPATLPAGLPEFAYMDICLAALRHCDAVLMLEGWESSKGARAEKELAAKIGLIIFYPSMVNSHNQLEFFVGFSKRELIHSRNSKYMAGGAV